MSKTETPKVYQAMAQVMAELSKDGVSKNQRNQQGGYNFRGIDQVYNALAPLLSKAGLVIIPHCLSRKVVERQAKSGNALFYVTVSMEFDFVCAEDGSSHKVGPMYGEAMDSGDKATNKAMSAAYKYACFQSFCIPTEGDNDADAHTHEVVSKPKNPISARQIAKTADIDGSPVNESKVADVVLSIKEALHEGQEDEVAKLWASLTNNEKTRAWGEFNTKEKDAIRATKGEQQ